MVTLVLIDEMVEQVRPVVRPLLATPMFNAGVAIVAEGAAAAMVVVPDAPRSRIVPAVSTWPAIIWAIAASTLLGAAPVRPCWVPAGTSVACSVRLATVIGALKHAACPG